MNPEFKIVPDGTVTSPRGFLAGAIHAGIKTGGDSPFDLGILYSETLCTIAGAFTTNKIKAAPVVLCQERIKKGSAQALVVNSGCANACTGEQGFDDAVEIAKETAGKLGLPPEEICVASTGVIGIPLSMERIRTGIKEIRLSSEGGHNLAKAIMTTDTFPKEIAISFNTNGTEITVGGIAKGAGMIHPNMATMLCFLTTDAPLEASFAKRALQNAIDRSFNMITVDGDTSTNDTVLLFANGLAGNKPLESDTVEAKLFQDAISEVCLFLAKGIVRGGEGATKIIEINIKGALTPEDAKTAARTIAGSSLVKTAIHGCDPNWGRIIAALGRSGADIDPAKIDLHLSDLCLMEAGRPVPCDEEKACALLTGIEVYIKICLNLGNESATAWSCDLSEEYVTINSDYTT